VSNAALLFDAAISGAAVSAGSSPDHDLAVLEGHMALPLFDGKSLSGLLQTTDLLRQTDFTRFGDVAWHPLTTQ
jgi:hypothetical protein